MAHNSEILIDIQGLRTQFGRIVVHDQLELQVRRGEILSVVGGLAYPTLTAKIVINNAIIILGNRINVTQVLSTQK